MSPSQQRYRNWAGLSALPVFFQPWRLDALLGPDGWDLALYESGGSIGGIWLYAAEYKWGVCQLRQPVFTHYWGPYILYPDCPLKTEARYSHEVLVLGELARLLPAAALIRCRAHPQLRHHLPLHTLGWRQRNLYTYRLDLTLPQDQLWANLKSEVRTRIRKADKLLHLDPAPEWKEAWALVQHTFARQGLSVHQYGASAGRLFAAQQTQQAGKLYLARNAENRAVGSLYIIYDAQTAYLQLEGQDPVLRNSGVGSWLLWHAIADARAAGKQCFDFEGSMLPTVEPSYRAWGGALTPCLELEFTAWPWLAALTAWRERRGA